jgi:hypothetical protein
MNQNVMEIGRPQRDERTRRRLEAELDGIAARLQAEPQEPIDGVGGDFFDVAQGVEYQ